MDRTQNYRQEFSPHFRTLTKQAEPMVPWEGDDPFVGDQKMRDKQQLSPRHRYINKCRRTNLCPEPLLLRKSASTELALNHYGLGDTKGMAIADGLERLPEVSVVNLAHNRFSDGTVSELVKALMPPLSSAVPTGKKLSDFMK